MSQTCNTSSITATTPTSEFIINNDGTVIHSRTNLIWKVCSEGQTWDNGNCTGDMSAHTWQEALQIPQDLNACDGYGSSNNKDWRLPNIKELISIVKVQCYSPIINDTIFPSTASNFSDQYWSSSPYADYSYNAWIVVFSNGSVNYNNRSYGGHVRLVRGDNYPDTGM